MANAVSGQVFQREIWDGVPREVAVLWTLRKKGRA